MTDNEAEGPQSRARGFEWDENKRLANLAKHGIDFAEAREVFDDPNAYVYTARRQDNEERHVTVGTVKGMVIAVISTLRGSATRIISARMARREERQRYGRKDRQGD